MTPAPQRRAVIDVGTNSVKLLVADVHAAVVVPIHEQSEQTRLGEGFYPDTFLQPHAIARTIAAIARFLQDATHLGASPPRIIGTSATREARNAEVLADGIRRATGLNLEIVSGDQEAEWAYAGVRTDPRFDATALLILDIGGGSSEFILGQGPDIRFRQSFPIGAVRLNETWPVADPPTPQDWTRCRIALEDFWQTRIAPVLGPALRSVPPSAIRWIGTGGTLSILGRMHLRAATFDRAQLDGLALTQEDIQSQREKLWRLPLAQRRCLDGLPPNRADIILMGAAILEMILQQSQASTIHISTRGLRFAAVLP